MSTPSFPADANNRFFDRPILNSPYAYPGRHWELDSEGQPTQQIIEMRRRAEFITAGNVNSVAHLTVENSVPRYFHNS
jgi:hypothetical protein